MNDTHGKTRCEMRKNCYANRRQELIERRQITGMIEEVLTLRNVVIFSPISRLVLLHTFFRVRQIFRMASMTHTISF